MNLSKHLSRIRAATGSLSGGRRAFVMYLVCASTMALLLALYYILRHRAFAFVDIGIDTFSYYYPSQVLQARQLRALHPLGWSFSAGLGSYFGFSSNLFIWLQALFPESWQLGLRLPTYLLRLLLAGGFMFGYLRQLKIEPLVSVAGALAYAFCGYALVNGQWDTQGYVVPQLAAYLFFFERYFRQHRAHHAVLAGFIVGSGAVFDTYTFSLLSLLYVAARPLLVSREDNARPYLRALPGFIGWAALGAMLMAAVLVPNLYYFLSSPRVSGDHSVLQSVFGSAWKLNSDKTVAAELAGFFGKGLLGTGSSYHGYSNWFEAPGFYVSLLMLTCIPQLLGPRATRREKWTCVVGLALLLIYLLWPFMRYAVYGFGHHGFRLSTLWVSFGLLILGTAGMARAYRSGAWRKGLVIAATANILVALVAATSYASHADFKHLAIVLTFALAYAALLWPSPDGMPRTPVKGMVIVLACELLIFALPPMIQRTTVASDGTSRVGSYHDGTREALAAIRRIDHGNQFYRVEKTYRSIYLNDAMVQDYSGTKSYFFHGKFGTRFVDKMELPRPHPRTNYVGPMTARPAILDLLGVKYLLARDRKLDKVAGMTHVGKAGKIQIYRNTDAHGTAHLYQQVVSEKDADKLPAPKRDALLLGKVVLENADAVRNKLAAMDANHAAQAAQARTDQVSVRKIDDEHLRIKYASAQAAVLLIAMPFDKGWSARLDQAPARLFVADYGLTALLVPPGTHELELHYDVPGLKIGLWLSGTAAILLLVLFAATVFRKRSRPRG